MQQMSMKFAWVKLVIQEAGLIWKCDSIINNINLLRSKQFSIVFQKRLRVGLFYIYMKDLLNIFPREQILYFRLEDYKRDKLSHLRKIISFLDLGK